MDDFSSLRFPKLYLNNNGIFPLTTIINSFKNDVDWLVGGCNWFSSRLHQKNGGFTVKLCYKPCLIIYHINGTGEKLDKVEAVDIDTHIFSILPTDRFLNCT